MNKILFINLTEKSSRIEELPVDITRKYIGGRGLGVRLLFDSVKPDADPFSPENPIIFTAGPLQGSSVPFSGRTQMITKSPQTGIYLYTNAGGTLGINMRACGYTAMVITGKSEDPVFLQVVDDRVSFRDAGQYWGLMTSDAQRALLETARVPGASVAVIGPAGEHLLKTACVVTEGERRRTFGRGGCGAVWGAKNLKGLVIKGSQKITRQNPLLIDEAKVQIRDMIKAKPEWRYRRNTYGTPGDVETLSSSGMLPARNWQSGVFDKVENIGPDVFREKYVIRDVCCSPYCITPCSKVTLVREGEFAGMSSEGPEYETVYAFGSNCGIDRFDAIIAADRLCDELGMDTISAGVTTGFAMECFERGLLSQEDCDGLEISFGNYRVVPQLLHKMAYRQGIGGVLADGAKAASQKVGGGSEAFAMHSKGMEFGGYDCRGYNAQALQFALGPRGGCHHDLGVPARIELSDGTGRNIKGKGEQVKKSAIIRVVYDSSILCSFGRTVIGLNPLSLAITGMTGQDVSVDDLEEAALRTLNIERVFNILAGIRRKDDRLPDRLLKEPAPAGPNKGLVVPLEELKDDFYESFGWDQNGFPKPETLRELGLGAEAKLLDEDFRQ
ncbi:MAG: aldehyde ferredoxin oxidoreductase [Firmicutes bacterium HGW-Firmicutes-14]|nr:MAG: aldehyde ferredoxin oxidoreductase [Firmicutes bacterium HGW-Firmicutes-14]